MTSQTHRDFEGTFSFSEFVLRLLPYWTGILTVLLLLWFSGFDQSLSPTWGVVIIETIIFAQISVYFGFLRTTSLAAYGPELKDGFSFPEKERMPGDIADLPRYNSVIYSHVHFDAVIDKLMTFLVSRM